MKVMAHIASAGLLFVLGCNPDPGEIDEQVGYRTLLDEGPTSGERGSVRISEVLWSGSVSNDGHWNASDGFVEVRNEGTRPINLSGWFLIFQGAVEKTVRFPDSERVLDVGEHGFMAVRATGCFPDPDWVAKDLEIPLGDPMRITLRDADERLIDSAGDKKNPPMSGGYDLVVSRSMERLELMFGQSGSSPQMWKFYVEADTDVPNNDRIISACRQRTLASPGRPNSPDYSGAYASGGFE